MQLTTEQLRRYHEDGFIMLRGLLTPGEVALLERDAEVLRTPQRGHPDANVYEKDGKTLRAAWAVEKDSQACDFALRLPRLLGPVRQLLGDDIYLYQSRLNYKEAQTGDVFQWHQDYGSWAQDGVENGDHYAMLSVLVMLDDTQSENGPLQLVRGSHKAGLIPTIYDTETTSYALHKIPDDTMAELIGDTRPFECVGPKGTVVLFGGCVVHGSRANCSDQDRRNLYFAYNRRDNIPAPDAPRRKHANAYIMNDDTSRLDLADGDALIQLANDHGLLDTAAEAPAAAPTRGDRAKASA